MENNEELNNVLSNLDSLLGQTDLSDVTAEGPGFSELPDGFYLTEVEKAELKESKSSHNPMIALQLKVVEDGYTVKDDGEYTTSNKTKNRKVFIYYVLKDEASVQRMVTDMLKFEGETEGESLLSKECFTTSDLLFDSLDIIVGRRIYMQVSTKENKEGEEKTWKSLLSWSRVKKLELPE